MSLTKIKQRLQQETGISHLFPITHLNSASIFETKQGAIGATLQVEGISFVMAEPDYLNEMSFRLHQALLHLDERFMAYVTIHRHKEDIRLKGEFKSPFAKRVNEKYHARFQGKSLYRNAIYLTVVLKGDNSSKAARTLSWWSKVSASKQIDARQQQREAEIALLLGKMEQLKTSLSPFKPHLLGEHDRQKGYSELLAFLSLIPNAGERLPFTEPQFNAMTGKGLLDTLKANAKYPEGNLSQYVTNKQLFFGQSIQFQGASGSSFAAMLSIKKYGLETSSVILDKLLELDCEYILTHSFAPVPRDVALNLVDKKRGNLLNAKDLGASQIQQLSALEDGLSSEVARLGFHHNSLMLLSPDKAQLEDAIREAVKAYASAGIVLVRENLGQELAYWSQIPGNHAFIARASLITSHNFVDFCSLHNFDTGFRNGNHLGEAVTLLETPSKTPVFFNYHSQSSKTNPAKGHTAIFGATNAGKNTLVSFLDAQMGRYDNRSFFFDRDEASKIYVLSAPNSSYTVISPKHAERIAMNPFMLTDTPHNRSFVKDWFAELIKQPNENDLPSSIRETINECVNYAFDHLERRYRNLSNIARCLPKDFPRWPELKRWLRADETREAGEFAWLFDHDHDALNVNFDKVGFDITYLMDEVSPLISTPVYMYLLHRVRLCLDGRLTSIVIDEAWQVFNSPFWLKHLKAWAATIRKKNGHFIFMTQTPESIVHSPIAAEIITNVATSIYFPNPAANEATYIGALGLSRSEYQTIKSLTPESRLFLYKQDRKSILCKLDLGDLPDEIRVFSGNEATVRLLDSIIDEVSANAEDWLPVFIERSGA
ncbi:hypothetical protein B1207_07590 [Legionella quinlivanii]|uniref:Type IV secretion system protein virB4 n=1 Tax=Legionella quinlivanii TaxID=45073 RepID=A0A364LJE4_9GAMM|nr:VirB4 family type IV secretion/conjugal transfer ATPase [Legionella quinlivanii]RAP36657.1 hypothetical protein B1207_07590 [Legionella quinlivanii]